MVRRSPDASDCALVRDAIDAHLSGLGSAAQRAAVEAHTARCPACRDELELAADIRRELSALPRFDAPPRIIEAVRQRARETPALPAVPLRRSAGRRNPAWMALAAAAVAGTAIALLALLPGRSTLPPQAPAVEVARATAEARYAFALVAGATSTAQKELRQGVLRDRVLATALRGISRATNARPRSSNVKRLHPTPNIDHGGSS